MNYQKMWNELKQATKCKLKSAKDIMEESSGFYKAIAYSDVLIYMECLEKENNNG